MWKFVDILTEIVTKAGMADRILNERQLDDLVGGSDARRYGLVNRALKEGSLIRLRRGRYLIEPRYRREPVHPFAVAQAFVPGSYVSFETALAYHGWIPEGVFTTSCVSPGRKTITYDIPSLGVFGFHPLALREYQFLVAVDRVKIGGLMALVASPLRALMDLIALRKERWSDLAWLVNGMRIDEAELRSVGRKDFAALEPVYKHQAVREFLNELRSAVVKMESATR